ncbi:MAG: peptide deformylase [Coriobacteriia bacterium]|nr:peptide deformylase [Coriobacteriia bacterium]
MDIKQAVEKLRPRAGQQGRKAVSPPVVLAHPDPRLLQKSCEVTLPAEDDLQSLVDDLIAAMRAHKGVGLAAIQIGVPKRLFVYDDSEAGDDPRVLINPRITQHSDDYLSEEEGCLSFPGLYRLVKRYRSVTVEGLDLQRNPVSVTAEDFLARVFQHELDHLDGRVFITHLSEDDKKGALREYFDLAHS